MCIYTYAYIRVYVHKTRKYITRSFLPWDFLEIWFRSRPQKKPSRFVRLLRRILREKRHRECFYVSLPLSRELKEFHSCPFDSVDADWNITESTLYLFVNCNICCRTNEKHVSPFKGKVCVFGEQISLVTPSICWFLFSVSLSFSFFLPSLITKNRRTTWKLRVRILNCYICTIWLEAI